MRMKTNLITQTQYKTLLSEELLSKEKQENFESLIDLFTLLSFSLILVAIFWGIMSTTQYEGSTFKFSEMEPISSKPIAQVPENIAVLFLTVSQGENILYITTSDSVDEIIFRSSLNKSIDSLLNPYLKLIMESERIQFIVDETVSYNPNLLIKIEKWLSENKLEINLNFYNR